MQQKFFKFTAPMNKRVLLGVINILLLCLLTIGCSYCDKGHDPAHPDDFLTMHVDLSNLDTVTPPLNPLKPMDPESEGYPVFLGYLDFAKYCDGIRYCALIGLTEATTTDSCQVYRRSKKIYFLLDKHSSPIQAGNPLLNGYKIGEIMYVGGWAVDDQKQNMGILVKQIQSTGKVASYDDILYNQITF